MIARIEPINQPSSWQRELREAYRDPLAVLDALDIEHNQVSLSDSSNFSFLVPRRFVQKMRQGDASDPLLRQVLPLKDEDIATVGYSNEPNRESAFQSTAGLLQKYNGRGLIIATGGCAINCRYCFRRNFPYQQAVGSAQLSRIVTAVGEDQSISEVILSGGDPLLLDDDRLEILLDDLSAISHLVRLRIHTRLPVTIPARITEKLLQLLDATRLNVSVVFHINHPNEIDPLFAEKCLALHQAGVNLLNQAVLLRAVNDRVETLAALCEKGFSARILPYYVHLLDPVSGSAHFSVSDQRALGLETALREMLPGYLVPKFVREIPAERSKTPVSTFATSLDL